MLPALSVGMSKSVGGSSPYKRELEYIGCTNSWFNTGICLPSSDRYVKVTLHTNFSSSNARKNNRIFWTGTETSTGFCGCLLAGSGASYTYIYGGGARVFIGGSGGRWIMNEGAWSVYLDTNTLANSYFEDTDTDKHDGTVTGTPVAPTTTEPFVFLRVQDDETIGAFASDGQIYSIVVEQMNLPESNPFSVVTTVLHLIPVEDNDGNAALYDKVSGKLFYSANDNAFTIPA